MTTSQAGGNVGGMSEQRRVEAAVRAWAEGDRCREAAVELLIRQGIAIIPGAWYLREVEGRPGVLGIDVPSLDRGVPELSSGERAVLDVAVSLLVREHVNPDVVEHRTIALNAIARYLDRDGLVLVLAAIAHAAGDGNRVWSTFAPGGAVVHLPAVFPWPEANR